jgi:hypothetical protein
MARENFIAIAMPTSAHCASMTARREPPAAVSVEKFSFRANH